ncbi:MAG: hypothetical protein K2Q22_11065, partial [Cytophagales bacterium]|nr:hypothetical protein [Cytophagales bacterium]
KADRVGQIKLFIAMFKKIVPVVILSMLYFGAQAQNKPATTSSPTNSSPSAPKPASTPVQTAPRPSSTPAPAAQPQVITVQVPTPEATPPEDLKPEEGNITAEVNFTPFGGTPIGISYIRGRFFVSDLVAIRAGVTLSVQTQNVPTNTNTINYSGGGSMVTWGILPGVEFHFEGTRRLSPFVGAQLDLLARNAGYTQTTTPTGGSASTIAVTGALYDGTSGYDANKTNYFNPGLSLLLGADFYFSKHIYVGTEFGLGVSIQTRGDITVTSTSSAATVTTVTKGAVGFGVAPVYNSAIRVGFVF